MPIYEYICGFCSHKFQLLQKMSDAPPEVCPNCGKKGNIKKLISPTSFKLKGSGWYVTDYANSKSQSMSSSKPASNKNNNVKKQ